jgi:pimeloyl-ACP methyl ester carboxylesterase
MTDDRIHRAVSADGTEIVGRVQGQGPPLVLVHGAWGDGEVAWEALLPHLTDRFTCYTPNTRGRGSSGDNPDHSVRRLVEDVSAFIDSIGEPVCLVGWSGIEPPLGAAAQSDAVAAVALFEGYVSSVAREDDLAHLGATMERVGEAAADGRLADAARAFAPFVLTDDELASMDDVFFERWGRSIPAILRYLEQNMSSDAPRPFDPDQLARISVPVLAMVGLQTQSDSATWLADSAQHIAQHVADGHVRELPGVGHFGPGLTPEPIARELISFFEKARQPA